MEIINRDAEKAFWNLQQQLCAISVIWHQVSQSGLHSHRKQFRSWMATNGTVARIILALTLGLFVYYFLWVSVVPFLLVEEGNRRMSPHV